MPKFFDKSKCSPHGEGQWKLTMLVQFPNVSKSTLIVFGASTKNAHIAVMPAPYGSIFSDEAYSYAIAKTATIALNNATYPFIEKLSNLGYQKAIEMDVHLKNGLNVYDGVITNQAVAMSQKRV